MVKLGVFSLWNGQHAFHSRPARVSLTVGAITALSTVRARSSSRKAVESVIGCVSRLGSTRTGFLQECRVYRLRSTPNEMLGASLNRSSRAKSRDVLWGTGKIGDSGPVASDQRFFLRARPRL